MWPIQLAFLRLTERTMLLPLTTMQHSISHTIGQADRLQPSPRTPFKTFDVHLISNIFVFSLLSSRSRLRLLPRLLATSIFFYITCFVRQFPRKMWPIQLALLHLTERTVILSMYIWFTSRHAQVTEPYKATISLSRKIHGWTKSPVFEHSSLFSCYRHCKLLQAIWKGQMSHSSGSFKRIGGFLEYQMSVTTYVATQTASPLDFEWNRKAQEVGGSGRGDKWDREEKGSWK
jgi:hypothetical protein